LGTRHDAAVAGVRARPQRSERAARADRPGIFFVPLIIAWAIGEEQYWLTATFSILYVALADPGGSFGYRAWQMARVAQGPTPPVPEIPGDTSPRALTKPLIAYAVLRAIALAITVAIAFGLHLPNADWMPIAALVAIKPSLDQTTLVAERRLGGAFIGATLAAVLLLTITSKHALEVIMIVVLALGASIRAVNYALYNAAIAAGVLIALDLPHPSNLGAEGERVLFTFIGVGIGVIIMLLAGLLAKRSAKAQLDPASQPA
jgi:uncharacterized membrane protein YccC